MIGRQVSRYRIVERLGSGGMGVVYKAQDTELGRFVALKFLPTGGGSDPQILDRFIREARAAAALNHPHICTIYEVSGNREEPFIAMEYLDGETLRQRISGRPLPEDSLLEFAVQLADALAAAHEHHVVHRDLKPANIFITKNNQIKILDFGLAKQTQTVPDDQPTSLDSDQLTVAGSTVGTVSYMSPEQARGEQVDQRSDIFSIGAVIYEMATGQIAFSGNTEAVIYNAILSLPPTPPDRLNSSLPAELVRIISKCLEKRVELRYQNAADLRSDLRRLQRDTDSGVALPLPAKPRVWRKPVFAGAGVLVLAALIGILIPRLRGQAEVMKSTDVILLTDFVNTTGDPAFDGTLKQALAVKFEESPFLNIFPEQQVRETLNYMRRSADEKLTPEIGREICQRQNLKAMLNSQVAPIGREFVVTMVAVNCDTGNVLARDQVQAPSKEGVLRAVGEAALHMREKLGESLPTIEGMNAPIEQATTSSLEALKAFTAAEGLRARGADVEAMPFFQRAIDLDPMFTLAYARLGVLQNNAGEREEARKLIGKAYELRERVSERERFYVTAHYYRIVERDQEKSVATYKLWRQTYPRDYIPAVNLGNIYQQSGRLNEATQQLEESLKLNPSPTAFLNLTGAYSQLGKPDKVLETCKTWMEKIPTDGTPHYVKSNYHSVVGEYDQELSEAKRAVELEPIAVHQAAVARAYINLNRLSDAKAVAESAIAAKMDHPDLHYYLVIIAQVQRDQAALDREFAWSKGKSSEFFFIALQGSVAASRGRLREAEGFYKRSVDMAAKTASPEEAARFRTTGAVVQALFGNSARAKSMVSDALKTEHYRSTLADAAVVYAFAGDDAALEPALTELNAKDPNDVFLSKLIIPSIRATAAIHRQQPEEVFKLVGNVDPYKSIEVDFIKGVAHAKAGRHQEAVVELQKVVNNPGLAELSAPLTYEIAYLHIARSYAALGDTTKARDYYEKFLAFFKNPDPGIPLLEQARAEYSKLKSS